MELSVLDMAWSLRDLLEEERFCSFLLPEVDRWIRDYQAMASETRDEILKSRLNSLKESPYFLGDTLLTI